MLVKTTDSFDDPVILLRRETAGFKKRAYSSRILDECIADVVSGISTLESYKTSTDT